MSTKFYIKSLCVFFTMFFLSVNILRAQATESEPNNTSAQANVFPLNGSITAAINPAGDVDWYKVTTTSDGDLNVTFDNSGNGDLKVIILFDNDGVSQLTSSQVGNGVGGINQDGLAAGIYYIQIRGNTGTETGSYSLSNTLTSPARSNDAEPNNNVAQALTLHVNDSAIGHIGYYFNHYRDTSDWYKVTTSSDGQVDIIFDNTGNGDVKVVTLFDNDGVTQLGTDNIGNGIGMFNTGGLASGTYYIQIIGANPNDFGAYKLYDSLEVASQPNDVEPNNNAAQAINLPLNTNVTGHYGYYYNNSRDTSDWYQITVPTRGSLSLMLDNTGNGNVVDLNLYDASGVTVIASNRVGNGSAPLNTDTLNPGNYYAQIAEGDGGSFNQFGAYQFSANLFTALPVTFTDFSGTLVNDAVKLSWQTATESNNKGFEVQKSIDGQTFSEIGFVAGHGNSSVANNYNFIDAKTASGYNYYRLKQIDLDDHFIYSSIIKIDYLKFSWQIAGNPVGANTWVQLQLDKSSHITIQVISMQGSIIQQNEMGTLSAGTHSVPLNLSRASAGMYIVRLITDNQSYTQKIIK